MSKRQLKRDRVKKRWEQLNKDINELLDTMEYESFTEWKDTISEELIRIIKKHNVLSWYGKEWRVLTSVDPIINRYTFDVRTTKGHWRVLKISTSIKT